jgi:hypothetical protein
MNYQGPYVFQDTCGYDSYWLKVGRSLLVLWKNLERVAQSYPDRFLVRAVADDIFEGQHGNRIPDDLIARGGIDTVPGVSNEYKLIDEVDAAWLKFLIQPPANRALAGIYPEKPEDTLTILFDHRVQMLFSDPLNNPFCVERIEKVGITDQYETTGWEREFIPLNPDLLDMLNRGGRVRKHDGTREYWIAAEVVEENLTPPTELYQFSLEEARLFCEKLARMGRLE